jgi:polyisoprenoid-binding protein YceI
MMKSIALATAVAALLSLSSPAPAAEHDPKAVKSGDYKVDPAHTQVVFAINHLGFTYFHGMFGGASGELKLDAADPAKSQLDVTVPIASVNTNIAKLDGELKDKAWFDAATFPTATFKSTKVTLTGDRTATIAGDLTLHGVTKPVTLTAEFVGDGMSMASHHYTVGFEATGVIKRSEFGVSSFVPYLGDEVKLIIAGAFEAK